MHKEILETLEHNNVAFLTGPGGTGKTYNINKICEEVGRVARTATTGVAATHISGETIHRFSGIGTLKNIDSIDRITKSYYFSNISRAINLSRLVVVDEVSMLHRNQFELINKVFQFALKSTEPFGGKKMLFSGDFLQLPPVEKGAINPWVFHSEVWKEMKPTVFELTKIWRQDDKAFTEVLMNIRRGICGARESEMIGSRTEATFDNIKPVKLVSTNAQADRINKSNMGKIKGETFTYKAEIKIFDAKTPRQEAFKRDSLIKEMIAPEVLEIKEGSQVMILKNGDGYCNGTMGIVTRCDDDSVVVDTDEGTFTLEMAEWNKLNSKDEEVASFKQIPLKPAYAITVHKSQGMSLDYCEIDFESFFAPGQAYVALSRVKSLEGLSVKNWNPSVVSTNQDALDFYYGGEQ